MIEIKDLKYKFNTPTSLVTQKVPYKQASFLYPINYIHSYTLTCKLLEVGYNKVLSYSYIPVNTYSIAKGCRLLNVSYNPVMQISRISEEFNNSINIRSITFKRTRYDSVIDELAITSDCNVLSITMELDGIFYDDTSKDAYNNSIKLCNMSLIQGV